MAQNRDNKNWALKFFETISTCAVFCQKTIKSIFDIIGIEFAPWNIPLERRLQTFAAASWITIMLFGELACIVFTIYSLRTDYYLITVMYIIYMLRNRDAGRQGSRSWTWARNWKWWSYFRDYFPLKLVKTANLDPEKNYLFCIFPHGVLSTGGFGSFATDALDFPKLFPGMKPHMLTLDGHFMVPFFRELILWLGGCSASAESINYLLNKKRGVGKCAVLVVGGAAESLNCHAGEYKVILKRRKGFVKMAMMNGAPLVPVISFGETELFEQVKNPEGSIIRSLQDTLRNLTGIAPVIPLGRGIFQYNFGILPQRRPVTTVVGKPIEIECNLNPSIDEIEVVHQHFTNSLIEMFEQEKYKYLPNPENAKITIV